MDENAEKQLFEIVEEGEQEADDLQLYRAALQQEFLDTTTGASQRKTAKETKESINELIPDALSRLGRIIKFGSNEAHQLRASIWVLENALSIKGVANTDDPLVELVEGMQEAAKN